MSDKVYNRLKLTSQVVLPAVSALYFGLSEIWGLPFGQEVVGTIALVCTFLGALLKLSSDKYYKELEDAEGERENE